MKILKIMLVLFFASSLFGMESNSLDRELLLQLAGFDQELVNCIISAQVPLQDGVVVSESLSLLDTNVAQYGEQLNTQYVGQNVTTNEKKRKRYPNQKYERYPNQKYSCPLCSKKFAVNRVHRFRRHLGEKHRLPTYSCPEPGCSLYFVTQREMLAHRDYGHSSSYVCDKCNAVFSAYKKLAMHYSDMHYYFLYACKQKECNKEFRLQSTLFKHLISEHYGVTLPSLD